MHLLRLSRGRLAPGALLSLSIFALGSAACGSSEGDGAAPATSGSGAASSSTAGSGGAAVGGSGGAGPRQVKVAHFNIKELTTKKLLDADDEQATAATQLVARIGADIVCFNEMQFDIDGTPTASMPGAPKTTTWGGFDGGAENARRFADRVATHDPAATYAETIHGVGNSGFYWEGDDLGQYFYVLRGWGEFEGRFNTACISKLPILRDQARIVSDIAWEDLPESTIALMKEETGFDVPAGFPLFEKGLHIVPIDVGGEVLWLVLLHPVAPAFDPINTYRNFDELRALRLFLDGALAGVEPLPPDAKVLVMGDLNADPEDGDSIEGAIQQVLEAPMLEPWMPVGAGTKGTNGQHNSYLSGCGNDDGVVVEDPTTKFQLQLDYMLPSKALGAPLDGAIFFPDFETEREDFDLACRASDHRLLWAVVEM
jgi:hypothetical protein